MEGEIVLLPNEGWDMLVLNNFGLLVNMETGSTAVRRKVVEHGMFVKQFKVEVYFIELQLAENSNLEVTMKQKFSKSSKVGQIVGVMCHLFGIPTNEEVRLWNKYTSNTYEQLARMDMTTQDAGLFSGQLLIIERRQGDGTWARQARPDVTRHGRGGIVRVPEIVDEISRVEEQRGEEDENTRKETKVEDMIRSMRQELRLDLSSKAALEELQLRHYEERKELRRNVMEKEGELLREKLQEELRLYGLDEEQKTEEGKRREEANVKKVERDNDIQLDELKKLNRQKLEWAAAACEANIKKLGDKSEERMRKKIGEQEAVMQAFRRSMEEDDFQDMMPKEADPTPLPECPVCMEPMMAHIYQCGKGHLVCGDCKPKLQGCPSKCGTPLLSFRAFGVEQYVASLTNTTSDNI